MIRATLTMFIALIMAAAVHADNWPGWRGPGNQGISSEKKLPVKWDKNTNVRWKVAIKEKGVSQPVVWDDHVFITGSDGRLNDRLHVYCFRRKDGKQLWHTRLFGTAPTNLYPPGGMAVPTPVTDGKLLYLLFGTGELAALDFDGQPVWIRSLAEEYGPFRNRWGMGTSPILVDLAEEDRPADVPARILVIQVDHWSQSYLLAVDPPTGKNVWKTNRPGSVNWTSPLAVRVKGHTQLVTFGTNHVRGYDAVSGNELWHADGMHYQCIPSPVTQDNLVFACSGENTLALRIDGTTGDLTKSNLVWKNFRAKAFVPSPLAHAGMLYIPADRGFVTCLDTRTGEKVWKERMGGQYHASPTVGAGMVYFTSMDGVVRVIRTGPKFELLAENDLGETLVASPALSNGQIFLRGDKHLYCIGE